MFTTSPTAQNPDDGDYRRFASRKRKLAEQCRSLFAVRVRSGMFSKQTGRATTLRQQSEGEGSFKEGDSSSPKARRDSQAESPGPSAAALRRRRSSIVVPAGITAAGLDTTYTSDAVSEELAEGSR